MALKTRPTPTSAAAPHQGLRTLAYALGGSLLLALSAQVKVPMWPVPMTMQSAAVLLLAATGGLRVGAGAVAAYVAEAAVGLPVLAAGLLLLAGGPTLGYVAGFLLAALWVGFAADRGWTRRMAPLFATLAFGEVLIYAPGLLWLWAAYVHDVNATLAAGLVPFLAGEVAKLGLATTLVFALGRREA